MITALSDVHPFFLLGLRRMSERAGALAWTTFTSAMIALFPAFALVAASLIESVFHSYLGMVEFYRPTFLLDALTMGLWVSCFVLPYLMAGASDLFFRIDWRANSILLASPLGSREILWGKFAILFTMGLPVLLATALPLALFDTVYFPALPDFMRVAGIALGVYLVSSLYLSAFTRRWEAILFWAALIPASGFINGIIRVTVYLANVILGRLHAYFGGVFPVRFFPQSVPYPQIPIWVISIIVAVGTILFLIRRGTVEIEKMRTGQIPLGRLTSKSADEYKMRTAYRWARPEYTRLDRASAVPELYIPVQPGMFAPTMTDHVFSLFVMLWFLGKGTVRRLLELMPGTIRDNPIYIRHTSRFRGFLAGYFEPSGKFKSRVVAQSTVVVGLIWMLLATPGAYIVRIVVLCLIAFAIFSPLDAYVRLARFHRERLAWESVIISPFQGTSLISGTFGVLLAHRLIPLMPGSIWIVLLGLPAHIWPNYMIPLLFFFFALYFAGLSFAASASWFIADRRVTAFLLPIWGAVVALVIWSQVRVFAWLALVAEMSGSDWLMLIASGMALILVGFALPLPAGIVLDRFARIPFVRREDEGE